MGVRIPTARDAVSRYMIVLRPDQDLLGAIDTLVRKRAQGAPVLNEEGDLVGILTEKDCLRLLSNSAYGELAGGNVGDYMSSVKVTLTVDMDLFSVAEAFLATNFPVLPVLEQGKLVGRISRLDLLWQIKALERDIARERAREERERKERDNPSSIDRMQRFAGSHSPEQLAELLRNRKQN
ncbi:MAG TPA: CBS domain-containing protein [Vicinamibacteria bacterium]|nr:CBS domain-containing protein [Vicinamibacteria bacterium]